MDKPLEDRISEALKTEEAEVEKAKIEFTEELLSMMEIKNISRTELANSLNVKPSRITALLRGLNNFTLETMVRLCRAVGAQYKHHIQPTGVTTVWTDIPSEAGAASVTKTAWVLSVAGREGPFVPLQGAGNYPTTIVRFVSPPTDANVALAA